MPRSPTRHPAARSVRTFRAAAFLLAAFGALAPSVVAQDGPSAVRTGPPPLAAPLIEGATLTLTGLAEDERVVVRLAHGEATMFEERLGPAERVEIDAVLTLTPTLRRPCDGDAPSVHLAHRSWYASGSGRGAAGTCLRTVPDRVRSIDLSAWTSDGAPVVLPRDVWLPFVAAELRPRQGLPEAPDDLWVAWAIVATDPDLPPLPVPDHPERMRSDLRLHLRW